VGVLGAESEPGTAPPPLPIARPTGAWARCVVGFKGLRAAQGGPRQRPGAVGFAGVGASQVVGLTLSSRRLDLLERVLRQGLATEHGGALLKYSLDMAIQHVYDRGFRQSVFRLLVPPPPPPPPPFCPPPQRGSKGPRVLHSHSPAFVSAFPTKIPPLPSPMPPGREHLFMSPDRTSPSNSTIVTLTSPPEIPRSVGSPHF